MTINNFKEIITLLTLIITLQALLAYLDIRLPELLYTIGLMVLPLMLSFILLPAGAALPAMAIIGYAGAPGPSGFSFGNCKGTAGFNPFLMSF